jgi:hypothetical protein
LVESRTVSVEWFNFNPIVIKSDTDSNVEFRVKIDGDPSSVKLELSEGRTIILTKVGDGVWHTTLTPRQVLFGYQEDDVNHNFVGFLNVYDNETRIGRWNIFINVLDKQIKKVNVTRIDENIRCSNYIVNIWRPDIDSWTLGSDEFGVQVKSLTKQLYQISDDQFDFINIVYTLPSYFENRFHWTVKNDIRGIGIPVYDNSKEYGSSGNLKGITAFPLAHIFDMAETGAIHELGHQWINFLEVPILSTGTFHWPISSLARGIMGYSDQLDPSRQGLNFPYELVPIGDEDYRLEPTELLREFTDLDLYLMGLLPADMVGSHIVFADQNQDFSDGVLSGPVETVTVGDVVAIHGPRIPDASTSQKQFRVATIVVTSARPLNDDEMAFFDYFASRGEARGSLPFSSGFGKGVTKPFFVATRGLGSITTFLNFTPCSQEGYRFNTPPIADAGLDQTVDEGILVLLDGTGSHDLDNDVLRYKWTKVSGPDVTLFDADTASLSFIAPEVDVDTMLTFTLRVSDGLDSNVDTVDIIVRNKDTTRPTGKPDVRATAKQLGDVIIVRIRNMDDSSSTLYGFELLAQSGVIKATNTVGKEKGVWKLVSIESDQLAFSTDQGLKPGGRAYFVLKVEGKSKLSWQVYAFSGQLLVSDNLRIVRF